MNLENAGCGMGYNRSEGEVGTDTQHSYSMFFPLIANWIGKYSKFEEKKTHKEMIPKIGY